MSKWKKIIIGLIATILGCTIIFIGVLMYFFQGVCGNDIYKSITSPEGKFKAVIFQRDCGATTGFSTQISILGIKEQLENDSGNIYTSDGHPDNVAPEVTWINDSQLNIHSLSMVQVNKQEKSWGWPWKKIEITYK